MVDTLRTPAALLTTRFQPGHVQDISSQDFRDLLVSQPDFVLAASKFATFRPESAAYGAKFDGVTDDTAAWTAMFADITSQGYGLVILPHGTSIVQAGNLKVPNFTTIIGRGTYGTIIQRKASSNGVVLDTAGTTDALRSTAVVMDNFQVKQTGSETGPLIRWLYASECNTRHVKVFGAVDSGFQIVASWDSTWFDCFINWCGLSGQKSIGATIGGSALLISGGTAASGLGASAWGCNNLNFIALRVETFYAEGVSIQQNLGTNASGVNSQIRFYGCKWETDVLGTNNLNSNMIAMSGDARNIYFNDSYIAFDAGVGSNIGFFDLVLMYGNADIIMHNTQVWIGTANQVRNVIAYFPGIPRSCLVDHLSVNGVAGQLWGVNSGAILKNDNGSGLNVPYTSVHCITASAGAITSPSYSPTPPDVENAVSANRGDTNQTLTVGTDVPTQRWATTLTANRTVTLSTTGAFNGSTFRIVRTGLGAFTLNVGGLKTIPSATAAYVDVQYDGAAWVLTGYGTL